MYVRRFDQELDVALHCVYKEEAGVQFKNSIKMYIQQNAFVSHLNLIDARTHSIAIQMLHVFCMMMNDVTGKRE